MTQADKVNVLMHEYDMLGQQILSRYSAQFQIIGVVGLIIGGLIAAISSGLSPKVGEILIASSLVIFVALFAWADSDVTKAAQRLIKIETDVNERTGENLLQWESVLNKGGGVGHIIRTRLKRMRDRGSAVR
jgi:hypothetical protein